MTLSPLNILAASITQTKQSKVPDRGIGRDLYKRAQKAIAEKDETAALEVLCRAVALCDYAQEIRLYKGYSVEVGPILASARLVLQEHGYRPEDLSLDVKLALEKREN